MNKLVGLDGRNLPAQTKPPAGPPCLYHAGAALYFAESVTHQGDEIVFDTFDTVVVLTQQTAKNMQSNPYRLVDVLPGKPTYFRVKKATLCVTDCTDETYLMQLRAVRAGLMLGPTVPEKKDEDAKK